ncbi:MAG TPA: hypothetical protein VH143_28940 [Kofleriaceae bacterium]|jgi:hypothetical protein|nr:hypothetical protein [Kofleriaceae bacterium]
MRVIAVLLALATAAVTARADTLDLPARVVLGELDAIDVALPPGAVTLVTNAGDVAAIDAHHARWRLPTEHRPRRAIVAALDAGRHVVAWGSVALAAQARVTIATAPRATVVVTVGDLTLDPVTADDAGTADVAIVVAPEVSQAVALATDDRGHTTEKLVPLTTPPYEHALVLCERSGVTVIADAAPQLTATAGALAAPRMLAPGVFVAAWSEYAAGAEVVARVTDDDVAARCTLAAEPTPPARVVVASTTVPAPPRNPMILTPRLGFASNFARVASPTAGARIALPFGSVFAAIALEAYTSHFDTTANAVTFATRATAMPALLQLAYAPSFGAWSTAAGIGVGGAITAVQSSVMSSVVANTTRIRFAADAFVDVGRRLGPGIVTLELRYLELALDEAAASGQLGGLGASIGFAIPL